MIPLTCQYPRRSRGILTVFFIIVSKKMIFQKMECTLVNDQVHLQNRKYCQYPLAFPWVLTCQGDHLLIALIHSFDQKHSPSARATNKIHGLILQYQTDPFICIYLSYQGAENLKMYIRGGIDIHFFEKIEQKIEICISEWVSPCSNNLRSMFHDGMTLRGHLGLQQHQYI